MAFKDSDIRQHMADVGPQARVTGIEDVIANIDSIMEHIVKESEITTEEAAHKLLGKSQKIVPYDTGELHDSGKVRAYEEDGNKMWDVLYDAQHAMRVHETPLAYKQGKGPPGEKQYQYLALPAMEMREELRRMIVATVQKVIAKPALGMGSGPRLVKKGGAIAMKVAPAFNWRAMFRGGGE